MRYARSLSTVVFPTFNIVAISRSVLPCDDSSSTLPLRHSICCCLLGEKEATTIFKEAEIMSRHENKRVMGQCKNAKEYNKYLKSKYRLTRWDCGILDSILEEYEKSRNKSQQQKCNIVPSNLDHIIRTVGHIVVILRVNI